MTRGISRMTKSGFGASGPRAGHQGTCGLDLVSGKFLRHGKGIKKTTKLVGGLEHFDSFSHHIGDVIIPTDEVHPSFFRGVG